MPPLLADMAGLRPPPFGSSPLTRPSGNPGEAARSIAMVQEARTLLERALPGLPVAHPVHKAVTSAISSLARHAPPAEAAPGVGLNELRMMLAQRLQQSPLAALMAQHAGGAPGAGGGAPPMMPPAGGAPGGMEPPGMAG